MRTNTNTFAALTNNLTVRLRMFVGAACLAQKEVEKAEKAGRTTEYLAAARERGDNLREAASELRRLASRIHVWDQEIRWVFGDLLVRLEGQLKKSDPEVFSDYPDLSLAFAECSRAA